MHAMQQPLAWSALGEVMGVPAWKSHTQCTGSHLTGQQGSEEL
jgi:hypothetical protein